jgi:hypothetical protein
VDLAANVRRAGAVGQRFEGSGLAEAALEADDQCLPWSLEGGTQRRTLRGLIGKVLDRVAPGWVDAVRGDYAEPPCHDALLSGPADEVLAILCALTLLDTYVREDGKTVLYSTASGLELEGLPDPAGGPPSGEAGWIYYRELPRVRPETYEVLFPPRMELRFDLDTGRSYSDGESHLEHVAPAGERLTYSGRTWAEGEYHTWSETLSAWITAGPAVRFPGVPVADKTLRQYHAALGSLATTWIDPATADGETWAARLDLVTEHWRRTVRLPRWWADRVRDLRAERIGVLDADARKGRGCVYGFYSRLRFVADVHRTVEAAPIEWAWTNAGAWDETDLSACSVIPAELGILDAEQGVLQIGWGRGSRYLAVFPGQLELREDLSGKLEDLGAVTAACCQLTEDWQLSVILSAVPAAPGRWYRLPISYGASGLPGGASAGAAEVAVEGVEALFPYTDEYRAATNAVFDAEQALAFPDPLNLDVLQQVALAITRRLWLAQRDMWVGSYNAPGLLPLAPEGRRSRITWQVADSGAAYTLIEVGDVPVIPSLEVLLPEWVRRRIGGESLPGGR